MRTDLKRIVKKPDVRRLEILRAAEELFEHDGYTKTPVESIIKKAGIAKGTFYYYFKAKKDILEALVDEIGSEMEAYFKSIIERDNLSTIEKLQLIIKGPKKEKITSSSVMKIIHKPGNREFQEKLNILGVKIIAPLMTKVLVDGKNEGIFLLSPSLESIQIVLAGSLFTLDSGLFSWSSKKRTALLKALQNIFELLVGVKAGTFSFISQQ